jgi:hypothetical protein
MSPEIGRGRWRSVDPPGFSPDRRAVPLDVELEGLDAKLRAAGARARLAGRASAQPTRYFSQQLRSRLLTFLEDRQTRE